MKIKILLSLVGLLAFGQSESTAQTQTWPQVTTRYFVVTAPTSPSNNLAVQNIMDFQAQNGVVGHISTDIANDPAALNMPHLLRASQIIFTPAGTNIWDATNGPTGNFALQNGQRLAWGVDWKDTNAFLVSSIQFKIWSSDSYDTLNYWGNLSTNASDHVTPLTFSPTLVGELWDANGNMLTNYYHGESITNPVNRVTALIRVGYYATNMDVVGLDLNYFKNVMTLTNFAAFYTSTYGTTNWISSLPYVTAHPADTNGDQLVTLEGQRQIGLTYSIMETPSLGDDGFWFTAETGVVDGGSYTNTASPYAFYKAAEGTLNRPPPMGTVSGGAPASSPRMVIMNGPE